MKIGLIKFCIPIDLSVYECTTNSGVDDRYGLIKELLRRGHEVTVFTPLVRGTKNNPKEERWLRSSSEEEIPEHVRFIKNLGYAPGELPVGEYKMDVLMAEAGVGNFMFRNIYHDSDDEIEASLIRRFVHVINAHKGPVLYMHNDPSLPFYFRQIAGRKYPWGHKKNGYTNPIKENTGSKWVRDSAWGTFDEIFSDKKSVVLTRCLPDHLDYMLDVYDVDRVGYKEFSKNLNFEYMPPAYSYDLTDHYKFSNEIKYPLFYSGGDRNRRIAFRRYYEEMGIPTFVSGKWADEAMSSFEGINFMGWLENRRNLLDTLNVSGCGVQIQPKHASNMGWWTARPFEVAACKSMSFIDGNISMAKDFVFDSWFVLSSKEEAQRKIKVFLSLSMKDRARIINDQISYIKSCFTWERFTDVFISVCKKYLGDVNVSRRRRDFYEILDSDSMPIPKKDIVIELDISDKKDEKTSDRTDTSNANIVAPVDSNQKLPFRDIEI